MLGLRRGRQHVMLSLARQILNIRTKPKKAYDPRSTRRILILLPDSIGESLMATVFMNTVKAQRPDIEITVASGSTTKAMLVGCNSVSRFVALDEAAGPRRRMKLLAVEIKKQQKKFCLVVEMRIKLNPRILACLARIEGKHYLGYDKRDYKIFDLNVSHNSALHTVERWLAAAEIAVGQNFQRSKHIYQQAFSFPVDQTVDVEIESWLDANPKFSSRILINFYAKARDRSFRYMEAINLLRLWRKRFPSHLLLLLPVPGYESDVEKMATELNDLMVMVAPYPLHLTTSIALARRVDLVFTPDTGMVHIASVLNTPVIAVYRDNPENFYQWKPLSDRQGVIFTRSQILLHDRVYVHEFNSEELMEHVEKLLPV